MLERTSLSASEIATTLGPDRDAIETFVKTLFAGADTGQKAFASIRGFDQTQKNAKAEWIEGCLIRHGLDHLAERAYACALRAAQNEKPVVLCLLAGATFTKERKADGANIRNGLALQIDLDEAPYRGRDVLVALIGKPTLSVASGGQWIDPESGECQNKIHVYWRLATPTYEEKEHDKLTLAIKLASRLAGGDPASATIVHPMRLPGSVHRKAEPRLASIVECNPDLAIDLGEALEILSVASMSLGPLPMPPVGDAVLPVGKNDVGDVVAALGVIANPDVSWNEWNRVGMAAWRAAAGDPQAFAAFEKWSARSTKYQPGAALVRWQHYAGSPPTKVGLQTLVHLARAAIPGWRKPSLPPPKAPPPPPTPKPKPDRRAGDEAVLRLNKTYAFIRSRPTGFMDTAWRGLDGAPAGRMLPQKAMHNLHSNDFVNIGTAKNPEWANAFALWMGSELRREYKDAGYFPVGAEPKGVLNLFTGLAVTPRKGEWPEIEAFLKNIICNGDSAAYAYLRDLIFWKLQNPTRLPEVAILLIGKPGSGRGTFAHILKSIFGRYFIQFTDSSRVAAKFNSQLEGRLVVFYDETFFGHDPRIKQIMKGAVTEATRDIELKGIDSYQVPNVILSVFATNEVAALPIDINDRRYIVLHISDGKIGNLAYFTKLRAAIDKELPAFVAAALSADLREFETSRRIPRPTKAKSDLALMTGNIAHQYLYHLLEGSQFPGFVRTESDQRTGGPTTTWLDDAIRFNKNSKQDRDGKDLQDNLYGDYLGWMQREHPKKPPMPCFELFKQIEEIIPPKDMAPKSVRNPDTNSPRAFLWLWGFPSRWKARKLFAAYARQPITWEDPE
jgi:hypothetical protein